MIVYLATKETFRADILSNRIDMILTGTNHDRQRTTAMSRLEPILSFHN